MSLNFAPHQVCTCPRCEQQFSDQGDADGLELASLRAEAWRMRDEIGRLEDEVADLSAQNARLRADHEADVRNRFTARGGP